MSYKILLIDEITAGTFKSFQDQIAKAGNQKILLEINSPGGSITEGAAILAKLQAHKPGVEVSILGIAASMASVIACVGKPVTMASNSVFMLHDPLFSECGGNADELRKSADVLDTFKKTLVSTYAKKSGKSADEISKLMSAETWLDAQQALEMGFVDRIGPASNAVASLGKWKDRIAQFSPTMSTPHKQTATPDISCFAAKIKKINQDLAEALALNRIQQEKIARLQGERKSITLKEFQAMEIYAKAHLMKKGCKIID